MSNLRRPSLPMTKTGKLRLTKVESCANGGYTAYRISIIPHEFVKCSTVSGVCCVCGKEMINAVGFYSNTLGLESHAACSEVENSGLSSI